MYLVPHFLRAKSDNCVSLGTPHYYWEHLATVAFMWVIFLLRQIHLIYLAGVSVCLCGCLIRWDLRQLTQQISHAWPTFGQLETFMQPLFC